MDAQRASTYKLRFDGIVANTGFMYPAVVWLSIETDIA